MNDQSGSIDLTDTKKRRADDVLPSAERKRPRARDEAKDGSNKEQSANPREPVTTEYFRSLCGQYLKVVNSTSSGLRVHYLRVEGGGLLDLPLFDESELPAP